MTCSGKQKKNSGCVGTATRVDPAETDGAPRCRNWRCNRPLHHDGTCPQGCSQVVTRCPVCNRPTVIGGEPCGYSGCGLNVVQEVVEEIEKWINIADDYDVRPVSYALRSCRDELAVLWGLPETGEEAAERLDTALSQVAACNEPYQIREDLGVTVLHYRWNHDELVRKLGYLRETLDEDTANPENDEAAEAEAYDRYADRHAAREPRSQRAARSSGEQLNRGIVYTPMTPAAIPPTVFQGVHDSLAVSWFRQNGLSPRGNMGDDIALVRVWPDAPTAFTCDGSLLLELDTTGIAPETAFQAARSTAVGFAAAFPPTAIKRVWRVDWMTTAEAQEKGAMILGDPGHGWVQAALPVEDTPAIPRASE